MIEEIINNELVEIYFQPIVSIRTKKIYAFEALTRCTYNSNVIPPNELFHLAKEKGLSVQLDEMTRNKSIKKFHDYYLENNDLMLFLNFESTLINNFDSIRNESTFIENIAMLNIPFKNFVLEIKEDEISNTNALKKFCKTYKHLGFSIALDDFGTGSSTFDRINLIHPDIIKIDRSLFMDIKNNQINKEVVKAISKMSHNLGIRVLAEGVEDDSSICVGMKSTINLFQGYYFSKPSSEIDTLDNFNILAKIIEIAKIFKEKNIAGINKKREVINKYTLIANNLTNKFKKIEDSKKILKTQLNNYKDIEAMYLIDAQSSKQINDTIIGSTNNDSFKAAIDGDEHYLKEYYYVTLESKRGIFLSQKYISYATGHICKTFAKKFSINNKDYIICLDIVIEGV